MYDIGDMSLKKRIKVSRFILSCIFLAGYAAYTVYAIYYYRNYEDSRIGTILLCLIGSALALNVIITFVSYRINLMDKPRPKIHRFLKMAKYTFQLVGSAITVFTVVSTVQNLNVFSLIMSMLSIPFLLWSLFVNVLAELFDRMRQKFGRRVYVAQEIKDGEGNALRVDDVIARVDAKENILRQSIRPKDKNH